MYSTLTSEELEVILGYAHNLFENTLESIHSRSGIAVLFEEIIGSIIVDYINNQHGVLDALTNFSECVDSHRIVNFEYRKDDDEFGIELIRVLREEVCLRSWYRDMDDVSLSKHAVLEWCCRVIGSNDFDDAEEFYTASTKSSFQGKIDSCFDSPGFEDLLRQYGCLNVHKTIFGMATNGSFDRSIEITPIVVSRIILGGVR